MKKIRYPSVEDVEWYHDRILTLTGGERGALAKGNLEFALEHVKDVGEDLDRERAVVKKAAFLVHSLVTQHPFINGNKRTAFEVIETFLELNGFVLRVEMDEIYSFLSDLGSGRASASEAEKWIARNLAKKPEI
jgi:death on curing protein